jgi:two-component system, NtrC family, sensor kinase
MKLVPKLTVALVLGMCLVLGVNGLLRVQRETAAFERERAARHQRAATAVRAAMAAAWDFEGERGALRIMNAIANGFPAIDARWVPSDDRGERAGEQPTIVRESDERGPRMTTRVPIEAAGRFRGTVELVEWTRGDDERARAVVQETSKTAAFLALMSAVVAFALGHFFVGRPIRELSEHSRRVGRGDFAARASLRTKDELADLARDMNAMTERLVVTLEQLRHADRLATVGKLASGIAHELGTPLNVVAARAEMIAAGNTTTDESREYAAVIVTAAQRMTTIIRQVLQFARRKTVRRGRQDVSALVRDTAELLRPLAKKKEVTIEVDGAPFELSLDVGQMQQVLTNLVMNAVHASKNGGTITVFVEKSFDAPPADIGGDARDVACIGVTDHGGGIAAEDLPRIFEPFFTTKDVGEGTGLGLAVSYGIVRDHGGWITVDTEPGRGSTFKVFLPITEAS